MSVPPEIWTQIFLLSLPPVTAAQATHKTTLSLVCRLWNAIIESTPILWSRISIADTIPYVQKSLAKSGELQIEVHGICSHRETTYASEHDDSCFHFFTEVKRYSDRWRHVALLVIRDQRFRAPEPIHFPALESLELHAKLITIVGEDYLDLVTGAGSPHLRNLTLDGIEFYWDRISLPQTLSQLTIRNLDDGSVFSRQFLNVLAASPNLTVVRFTYLNIHSMDGTSDRGIPIELASLRELRFDRVASSFIRQVLEWVRFPRECAVSLRCWVIGPDPRTSFLTHALSSYHEIFERDDAAGQVTISVPSVGIRVLIQGCYWNINVSLNDTITIRDTLEWLAVSTRSNGLTPTLCDPQVQPVKLSHIQASLEFGRNSLTHRLNYLTPISDLTCITRIKMTGLSLEAHIIILSYLTRPQITGTSRPMRMSIFEPIETDTTQNGAMTALPFPGLCELIITSQEDDVVNAAIKLATSRSSSGTTAVPEPIARLNRVEFGEVNQALSPKVVHCSVPCITESQLKLFLELMEILDEDAEVVWCGERLSRAGVKD
ncbi:hypothetical protein FRC00_008307 [Tulasnella sp. 408]|nr:hypothetical protein FRC00_008307 [Tulasnella sp. 408]